MTQSATTRIGLFNGKINVDEIIVVILAIRLFSEIIVQIKYTN